MNSRSHRAALVKSLTDQAAGIYSGPLVVMSVLTLINAAPLVTLTAGILGYGASFLYHRHRALRLNAALESTDAQQLRYIDTNSVRTLIATAYCGGGARQAVGTLIEKLPNLETLHLIVGQSDGGATDQAELVKQLSDHAGLVGRALSIDPRLAVIAPWEIHPDDPQVLRRYLEGIPGGAGTWVDITGGTVAMSLAVARAAAASGHRTCYVANDRTKKSPVYYGVVEIVPEGADVPPLPESR